MCTFKLLVVMLLELHIIVAEPCQTANGTDHNNAASDHGEWVVVFRAVSGNGQSVFESFTKTSPCKSSTRGVSVCYGHYRNNVLDRWATLAVRKVKVELYSHCEHVAYVIFNGTNSNMTDWFDRSRVLNSSWRDIREPGNFFSFHGYKHTKSRVERRLYINKKWAGCPNDVGWMAVFEGSGVCRYERHNRYPVFIYSKAPTAANFNRNIGYADVLVISLDASKLDQCY